MAPEPEKHLPYFEVLDALRTADECVVCWQLKNATKARMESLLYELVTDRDTAQLLAQSHGYCTQHTRQLVASGDALGIGLLHRPILMSWLAHLEGLPSDPPYRFLGQGRDSEWTATRACPFCGEEQALAARTAVTITEWMGEEAMADALSASPPFCPLHFQALLGRCATTARRTVLLDAERRKIHSLLQELERMIDSFQAKDSVPTLDREKDSWIRAARLIAKARRPPPPLV